MSKDRKPPSDAGNPNPSGGKKRLVRVEFRRNRGPKARNKKWDDLADKDKVHGTEHSTGERFVPRGDLSRKRTIVESDDPGGFQHLTRGVVVSVLGLIAEVDTGDRVWPCTVRRILRTRRIEHRHPVIVGDEVFIRTIEHGETPAEEAVIEHVAPRRSELQRRAGRRLHTVAANVDQAVIVTSAAKPDPKAHLIDRYIVSALAGRMRPVICMNKIDLDPERYYDEILDRYRALNYTVVLVSAATAEGLDSLREVLRGKESVIAGQSGVGKSSLLNAIQPGLNLTVGEVSEVNEKGRHTTTTARLLKLDFGGYVVDTPGIRSFELSNVQRGELEAYFEEFIPLVAKCKFADCTHTHEIGCAVIEAVEKEKIHPERYFSYVKLFEESPTEPWES